MINVQLLEYIKKQLDAGTTKAEIERSLVSGGGWAKSDVDEAFSGLVPLKPEMPVQNRPIAPYTETSHVFANNNLSSQQNSATPIQSNFREGVLKSSVDLFKESLNIYKNRLGSFAIALSPLIFTAILVSLATSISANYAVFALPIVLIISLILGPLSTSSVLFVTANREKELSFSEIINGGF